MTELELEKIAYENANNINGIDTQSYIDGFIDGYEQGQEDSLFVIQDLKKRQVLKENEELKKDKDLLMVRNLDLVNQIEKMKEDVRTEMSRHSNLTENTLVYLLNKWS